LGFAGYYGGGNRVVIVLRNKRSIPKGTLSSIWRQAGITREIAENIGKKCKSSVRKEIIK